jgi:hypothetical protein
MRFANFKGKEGEKMIKINLRPDQEANEWILLEKILWVTGFSLPFGIILWAKLLANSK